MTSISDHNLEERLRGGTAAPSMETLTALRARLAERAADDGILDVAYAPVDSPFGAVVVAATPGGIVRLAFANEALDDVLDALAAHVSPRVLEAPARLDSARRELDEYFSGLRTRFDVPLDWRLTRGFRRDVLMATSRIPYGETGTYRSVASAAGNERAVRAAGSALASNPIPILVPCHRVLRSDGSLGGYRGGTDRKDALLRLESSQR